MQLGIDAKKSDQVVRGAVVMPNGTGKTKRVAVFAQGAKAEEAKAAGADIVGMDDLADAGQGRQDGLRRRDRLAGHDARGRYAGPDPRPARPDAEPEGRHRDARRRAPRSRTPRPARCSSASTRPASSTRTIGRRSFDADKLHGNLRALIEALNKAKPASSKGIYLRKVAVSSTMGVGVRVDVASINAQPRSGLIGALAVAASGDGTMWWAARPRKRGAGHPRPLVCAGSLIAATA